MAADEDPTGEHGEHGETPAAGGKHAKGKLGIFAGKHRDQILVVSSVLLVVLAWLSLRKGQSAGGSAGSLSPTSAAQAGLGNAGAVGGYNAAAQQGLQTLLANQSDQLSQLESAVTNLTGAGSKPPTAIASSLSSPTGSGRYLQFTDGSLQEVESDGSLFHLSLPQWAQIQSRGGATVTNVGTAAPTDYSTTGNLLGQVQAANPGWKP